MLGGLRLRIFALDHHRDAWPDPIFLQRQM